MMAQGTDGLSRGVMGDLDSLLASMPLHLSPLTRDPAVLNWCQSWISSSLALHVLNPEDWFTLGHGISGDSINCDGMWSPIPMPANTLLLWHPAPAAAAAALEELCLSRHKRTYGHHLFLCPRLYTHAWRKRLFKFADFVFNLSPDFVPGVWGLHQHEPLIIGVFLPIRPVAPWVWMDSPAMVNLQARVRRTFAAWDSNLHHVLRDVWHSL